MEGALNPTLHRLLSQFRLDRTWTRGEGVWLFDEDNLPFLDCYAQYGAVALGHNAAPVVDAARAALAAREPAMVQPYRAPHAVALANALTQLAPGRMAHCVFTNSGAETVEAAVKLVRARTGRPLILTAHGSYHGKTLGALAATGQAHHREGFGPLPPEFEHIPFGDAYALEARLRDEDSRTAAVLIEPIQGESGVHPAPAGYLQRVRELCSRHGVALILDEIQTGLGRTGRLFACEDASVAPDLLLLAKGLGGGLFPLGACLVAAEWWDDHFGLRHSSTFANNNVACRVGLAVLDALTRGGVAADVARKGDRLLTGLIRLSRRHPRWIAAVRGRGLLAALELRPPVGSDGTFLSLLNQHGLFAYAITATLAANGRLLLLPTLGETPVLRFSPPLVISEDELDLALEGLNRVFGQLERKPAETLARAIGALDHETATAAQEVPLFLPPPPRRSCHPHRFAFIMHPTRLEDLATTNPGFEQLSVTELRRFGRFVAKLPPVVVQRVPPVCSEAGLTAEGLLISLPILPEEMARRGLSSVGSSIAAAVDLATRCGAGVVGLGGHTTPYSRRGRDVVGRGPAITTGNALTAGMACAAVERALSERLLEPGEVAVAIVGALGSVGKLCAKLMARARPRQLLLVGNPAHGLEALRHLAHTLEWGRRTVEATTELERLAECGVVISATGAGRPLLDDVQLTPGTIVCDAARPPDTSPRLRARTDLLVIEGGLVAWPDPRTRLGAGNLLGLPDGVQLACLSETVLLALEGDQRDHGIGDDVSIREVDYAMSLAERHGFRLAPPPQRHIPTLAVERVGA